MLRIDPVRALYRRALRRPRQTILVALVSTLSVATGIDRLELATDGHALVPENAPEVLLDREIRTRFDIEDQIVVVVSTPSRHGVYSVPVLELVQQLTGDLAAVDGIRPIDLSSLATERSDRPGAGGVRLATFLDPFPRAPEELEALRLDLEEIQLYTGTLVSEDGSATAILVGVRPEVDRHRLFREVRRVVAGRPPPPGVEVDLVGAPVAEALLGLHILEDLGVPDGLLGATGRDAEKGPQSPLRALGSRVGLMPLVIFLMIAVFWVGFRSSIAAGLPFTEVVACLLFVFGAMGYLGVPIYLTLAVLPVILTTVGIADEIHVFSRYLQHCREDTGESRVERLTRTLDEVAPALLKTSMTSAVAFSSFLLSPIRPVQAFGGFAALGVLFCLLWSLTVIPALLVMIPSRYFTTHRPSRMTPLLERAARVVIRRPAALVAAALLVLVPATLAAVRVEVQDSWIEGFAPESRFRQATHEVDRLFNGTHLLWLEVDLSESSADEDFSSPEVMERVCELEAFARDQGELGVGEVLGPCAYLSTFHFMTRGRDESFRRLPEDRPQMKWLWTYFERVRGPFRLRETVDADHRRALVQVFLKRANYHSTDRLMEKLRDFESRRLAPLGMSMQFAGDVAVSQALISAIVTTEVRSLLWSLVGIFVVAALLLRSMGWALLCVLPSTAAMAVDFAVMARLGIPLGVATSMFPAMILGVGIDYAIHFVHGFRRAVGPARESVLRAMRTVGPAISVDALAVAIGFGVLTLSQVPANARLGGLLVLSVIVCHGVTLVLLPALVLLWNPDR